MQGVEGAVQKTKASNQIQCFFKSFSAIHFFWPAVKPKDLRLIQKNKVTVFQISPLKQPAISPVLCRVRGGREFP
jgi:hypothetical protein